MWYKFTIWFALLGKDYDTYLKKYMRLLCMRGEEVGLTPNLIRVFNKDGRLSDFLHGKVLALLVKVEREKIPWHSLENVDRLVGLSWKEAARSNNLSLAVPCHDSIKIELYRRYATMNDRMLFNKLDDDELKSLIIKDAHLLHYKLKDNEYV